jgi:periplasmic protein CpxP/Spy
MVLIRRPIAGAAFAALLGATLLVPPPLAAQAPPPQAAPEVAPAPPSPQRPVPRPPRPPRQRAAARVETQIRNLHAALKIAPSQEPQWNAVAAIMREEARTFDRFERERAASGPTMTAVANLRSYAAIAEAHADEMKRLVPAFEALYATMPETQKKNADAVFNRPGQRPR